MTIIIFLLLLPQLDPGGAQDISDKLLRRYRTEPEITHVLWHRKKYILKMSRPHKHRCTEIAVLNELTRSGVSQIFILFKSQIKIIKSYQELLTLCLSTTIKDYSRIRKLSFDNQTQMSRRLAAQVHDLWLVCLVAYASFRGKWYR